MIYFYDLECDFDICLLKLVYSYFFFGNIVWLFNF